MEEPTSARELFKGRHFDHEIIVLCVRWYLTFKLSSRDLVQMMAERGIVLAHTTILRWVQRYVPDFEKRWNHYARSVGDSWRVDETYLKVRGQWVYLYRAVDKEGCTVDFLLSKRRDVAAANRRLSCPQNADQEENVSRTLGALLLKRRHKSRKSHRSVFASICLRWYFFKGSLRETP